jgi:NAD+ kinase
MTLQIPQNNLNSNSHVQILIVSKETRLEYLQKHNQLENIDKKKFDNINDDHKRHYTAYDLLTQNLQKNNLKFDSIKDKSIQETDFENYQIIITLGGDGTFINSCARIRTQKIIGINSEPRKSVGGLAKFVPSDIIGLCERIANNQLEIDNWDRLSARVNGEELPFWAINEILISKPSIYQTSKLHVNLGDTQGFCYGNGIIIATQRGSTAFYHSASGEPFATKEFGTFGYALVLPFQIKGDITKTTILGPNEKLEITPKRSGHSLIFDCDEKRIFKLKDEDEVEIFRTNDNILKVVV